MLRHYDDFELVIMPSGERYVIQLLGSPAGEGRGEFELPFTHVELSNFYGRIGQVRRTTRRADAPDVDAAKKFGDQLFRSVFAGELLGQLRTSIDHTRDKGHGLRIRLRLKGVPELAELPWEFLYDQEQDHFLATSTTTPMVRYLDLPQAVGPLRVKLPLRVLVVISGPRNLPLLDAEGEWERLKETLGPLEAAGSIVLERLPSATLDALRRRSRGEAFHILHFIGHGGFDEIAGDGVLHFEDPKGMNDPIPGQILGNVLRDHDCLRLAVLNACEGARQSNKDPFSGVAQSLCQQRLPAIVAMQFEISDAAAKTFAEEFYGAIAEGFPVDASVSEARKALFGGRFGQEWATPVLYMRSPNGLLFEVQRKAKGASGEIKPEVKAVVQAAAPVVQTPVAPAPPPMPPPKPQPFVPSAHEEEDRRRREAERIQHERAVLELEQQRRRTADEQRQREERILAEQQRADEARRQLERDRQELEARRKADDQRRMQEEQRRLKQEEDARQEQKRQEQAMREREAEARLQERARREREAATIAAAAANAIKVPPPPPAGTRPMGFATSVEPPKKSHRVRNVILAVLGLFVGSFVVLVIIEMIKDSGKSTGTKTPLLSTESAATLFASADQFFAKGDYDHAIEGYRGAIAKDDSMADAHSHLCNAIAVKGENASGQKGDYAAAVSECERAVQLTPTSAEAHNNLCNALVDREAYGMELKGNFEHAIKECNQALQLQPNYPEAYNNLCNAVGTRSEQPIAHPGDRARAIGACLKAIELKPTFPEAHKNLGDLYRDAAYDALDRSDQVSASRSLKLSTAEYRTAVSQRPNFSRAQSALGGVLYRNASPDAIAELNKAVELDPSDYEAYFWRGYCYLTNPKDPEKAIADFNKVMELKPDLANGEYGLWMAYRAQGKLVEAREHLTRAYALDPNNKTISTDYQAAIGSVQSATEGKKE
jgi:tetratricopeptide (TPR) repeat protein